MKSEVGAWVPVSIAATLSDTPWGKKSIGTYRRWCRKQSMGKAVFQGFHSRRNRNDQYEVYIPKMNKTLLDQLRPTDPNDDSDEVGAWVPVSIAATLSDTPWGKKSIGTYRRWCRKQSMGKAVFQGFQSRRNRNDQYEVYIPKINKTLLDQLRPLGDDVRIVYMHVPFFMLYSYDEIVHSAEKRNVLSYWICKQLDIISISDITECSSNIASLKTVQRRIRLPLLTYQKLIKRAEIMKVSRKLLCTYVFMKLLVK